MSNSSLMKLKEVSLNLTDEAEDRLGWLRANGPYKVSSAYNLHAINQVTILHGVDGGGFGSYKSNRG